MQAWIDSGHLTSPMTGMTLEDGKLIPNRTLRAEIVGGRAMLAVDSLEVLKWMANPRNPETAPGHVEDAAHGSGLSVHDIPEQRRAYAPPRPEPAWLPPPRQPLWRRLFKP